MKQRTFSQRFWEDKKGNLVIWQTPNKPLIVWIVCTLLASVLSQGGLRRGLSFVGTLSLSVWAIMELMYGVNYFRKLLGLSILLGVIASSFTGLF